MNSEYAIGAGEEGKIKVLQLTDAHLFSCEQHELLGVNTQRSFQAVIDAVMADAFTPDFVLATGDLVQDHHVTAYHTFARLVKPLGKPLFWLEGNHDTQPQMGDALRLYAHLLPHKHILAGAHWQIILLDSHVEGIPGGRLSDQALAFLQHALSRFPTRYTLVALHHNLLPTGSAWLDQHSLANADELAEVLFPFKRVKALLHGHIHQQVDTFWKGYRLFATPSTCIQFKPHCQEFTLDLLSPGWRELTLLPDGTIETLVKRLPPHTFLPHLHATGY